MLLPKIGAIEIQDQNIFYEADSVTEYSFNSTEVGQGHLEVDNNSGWNQLVVSALELAAEVDPYQKDIPEGTVIRAVDALKWRPGQNQCDIRPRLLDKSTGVNRLVDTGSQISVTKKGPDDILDESIKLVAVNGTRIPTYGIKEVVIKINRKSYKIPAVVCDVQQDILGMDFIAKYKLNFEWDEFDELNIVVTSLEKH